MHWAAQPVGLSCPLASLLPPPVAFWRQATAEANRRLLSSSAPNVKTCKCDGQRPYPHHSDSDPHPLRRPHLAVLPRLLLRQEPAGEVGHRPAAEHRGDGGGCTLCRPLRPLHQVKTPLQQGGRHLRTGHLASCLIHDPQRFPEGRRSWPQ